MVLTNPVVRVLYMNDVASARSNHRLRCELEAGHLGDRSHDDRGLSITSKESKTAAGMSVPGSGLEVQARTGIASCASWPDTKG